MPENPQQENILLLAAEEPAGMYSCVGSVAGASRQVDSNLAHQQSCVASNGSYNVTSELNVFNF